MAKCASLHYSAGCILGAYSKSDALFHIDFAQDESGNLLVLQGSVYQRGNADVAINARALLALLNASSDTVATRLAGSFSYLFWHAQKQQLHIARDPLNSCPIYYLHNDSITVVASEARFFDRCQNIRLSPSPLALAGWLSGNVHPGKSMFREISSVPLSHGVCMEKGVSEKLTVLWDLHPQTRITYKDQAEYNQHFTQLLTQSVRRACTTSKQTVVSQMSGGLDSTSISALANQYVKTLQKELLPLSHIYRQSMSCNEQPLMEKMLTHMGLSNSINMVVDEGEQRDFLRLYPSDLDSPGTLLSPRYCQEIALVAEQGADVLLTGNGGDEICWGHSLAYTHRLRQREFGVIPEVIRACRQSGLSPFSVVGDLFIKPFLPERLLALARRLRSRPQLNAQSWLTPKAQLLVKPIGIHNPFCQASQPVSHARYHSLFTTATFNSVRSYHKVALDRGVMVRHPFFDAQLAEFSFAIPDKQLIQGAYPKWLLRNAMQNILPDEVCWNTNKVIFDSHFSSLIRENQSELRVMLQDTRMADMGLIDQAALHGAFEQAVAQPQAPLHVDLLYAILTFNWLTRHFPP